MLLVDISPASIDEALDSGMLVESRGELRFRHELARAAIEASIPPGKRLQLHRRMISLLEEDEPRDTARLAHHAIRAASPSLIVRYAPEAGDEAVRRGARREAVEFYEAALEQNELLEPDRVADLRVRLGDELRVIDRPEDSARELRLAIDHYRETGQTVALANALGLLQGSLWNLMQFDEGRDCLDEASGSSARWDLRRCWEPLITGSLTTTCCPVMPNPLSTISTRRSPWRMRWAARRSLGKRG